jgi:hypothetical protein
MQTLTYSEWLKSEEGQQDAAAILASCSNVYPDVFQINKQLRFAYQEYIRRLNESESEH